MEIIQELNKHLKLIQNLLVMLVVAILVFMLVKHIFYILEPLIVNQNLKY
jgi:hypothetical protein